MAHKLWLPWRRRFPLTTTYAALFLRLRQDKPGIKMRWRRELQQPIHQHVMDDLFWWTFLDAQLGYERECAEQAGMKEEGNKQRAKRLAERARRMSEMEASKSRIYTRLSDMYFTLFLRVLEWKDKDDFLWVYPDAMAQSVFCAFCEAFPQSLRRFTIDFKLKLCDTLSEWFLGIKPRAVSFDGWQLLGVSDPSIRVNVNGLLGGNKPSSSSTAQSTTEGDNDNGVSSTSTAERKKDEPKQQHNLDDFIEMLSRLDKERSKVAVKEDAQTEINFVMDQGKKKKDGYSCYAGPGPARHRIRFDVFQNSPLIKFYLDRAHDGQYYCRHLILHQSEIERDMSHIVPDPARQTYREIIAKSQQEAKKNSKQFWVRFDDLQKERLKLYNERCTEMQELAKATRSILTRQTDVREISDQICEMRMNRLAHDDMAAMQYIKSKRFSEKGNQLIERELKTSKNRQASAQTARRMSMASPQFSRAQTGATIRHRNTNSGLQ